MARGSKIGTMDPNRCQQCEHRDGGKCIHPKSLERKLPILCIVAEDDFQPKACPLHRCIELVDPCGIDGCPDCDWEDVCVPLKLTGKGRAALAEVDDPTTVNLTGLAAWADADDRVIAAAGALVAEWRANERNPSHALAQELMAAVDARGEAKAREEARKV